LGGGYWSNHIAEQLHAREGPERSGLFPIFRFLGDSSFIQSYEIISAMTTVLLTGASGYIGKHIALQLLNQGYEVRASVRSLNKSDEVRSAVRFAFPTHLA
jgi:hypothetical protein